MQQQARVMCRLAFHGELVDQGHPQAKDAAFVSKQGELASVLSISALASDGVKPKPFCACGWLPLPRTHRCSVVQRKVCSHEQLAT